MRWGIALLGFALLVGLLASWWLNRQIGRLRRYADAVTAGERVSAPDAAGEFGDLGRALDTMRERLEGKQYVEEYVHALTHELKSPLTAIRGAAELLEPAPGESPPPDADRRRFIATIRAQGDRLAAMIDKLLALAAVEHRQRIERPERIPVAGLLDDVAAQCAAALASAGVSLDVSTVDPGLHVDGDRFLLGQALGNLVDNAAAFAPRGSTLELSVKAVDGRLRIALADRGPGVPEYAIGRVFERFYSLPRPDGGSRSSGLGLCFVAQVATLHGGAASLDNREGGGAVAALELPHP